MFSKSFVPMHIIKIPTFNAKHEPNLDEGIKNCLSFTVKHFVYWMHRAAKLNTNKNTVRRRRTPRKRQFAAELHKKNL